MKYAVIKLSGQQFKVSEGDTIKVNKIKAIEPKVLMVSTDSGLKIGNPFLADEVVKLEKVSEGKGKKVRVLRFKAKSRYHKTKGFRQTQSVLKVISIGGSTKAVSDKPKSAKVETKAAVAEKAPVKRGRPAKAK